MNAVGFVVSILCEGTVLIGSVAFGYFLKSRIRVFDNIRWASVQFVVGYVQYGDFVLAGGGNVCNRSIVRTFGKKKIRIKKGAKPLLIFEIIN